jgi:spore coat protein CotH
MKSSVVSSIVTLLAAVAAAVSLTAQAPASPAPTADDFFDSSTVHEIRMTVNTRDWAELKQRYQENAYYLADLRWRDQVVRNIGIRSRGFGSRSDVKPGLRVDFDRYASSQEFLGLKSVVLDNMTQDPAMLKERVIMRFFNEMGIPAPRVAHARLFVNNEFAGLYAIVESVDKHFLGRHFGQNDGFLFEFHYTDRYGFEYLGPELERYAGFFEAKTHEHDSIAARLGPIKDMAWAISESPDSLFVNAVGEHLDLRTTLTYVAVENFFADNDGLLGAWGMNNFYLYRFEGKTLSQLVPWDKDSTFWAVDYGIWTNVDRNVLTRRALAERPLEAAYLDALRRCAALALREPDSGPGGGQTGEIDRRGWLEREVGVVYEQIRSAAREDQTKPFSNQQFEDEVSKVLKFARERPLYIEDETADR